MRILKLKMVIPIFLALNSFPRFITRAVLFKGLLCLKLFKGLIVTVKKIQGFIKGVALIGRFKFYGYFDSLMKSKGNSILKENGFDMWSRPEKKMDIFFF
uniref:Uncharacterized protein n=1 Tax=Manihot esculenta TaxID=3983 RepID=A0A2C9W7F7_MANES